MFRSDSDRREAHRNGPPDPGPRAVRVAGVWYARTPAETLGPLRGEDLDAFLDLLDRVAAARGEVR